MYTHFTSPIRRYADLMVHRLLTICLKEKGKTHELIKSIDYAQFAEDCSTKSLNAKKASKDCIRLFHCYLLKKDGPRVYDAIIWDIENYSIHIYIEELHIDR